MVNDVAYESLKVPGFIASMIMKVLNRQIKSKVHFDILKLKPAEFAKNCSVPCVFIIGREDKLVYPKRVKEIFDAYLGKQKTLVYSDGDHSSEREEIVLKQCYELILLELKRHSGQTRQMEPRQIKFNDNTSDPRLKAFGHSFARAFSKVASEGFDQRAGLYNIHQGTFNFDTFVDESRNEEDRRRDQASVESSQRQFTWPAPQGTQYSANKDEFDEDLMDELKSLKIDPNVLKSNRSLYDSHLQDFSLFLERNHL